MITSSLLNHGGVVYKCNFSHTLYILFHLLIESFNNIEEVIEFKYAKFNLVLLLYV